MNNDNRNKLINKFKKKKNIKFLSSKNKLLSKKKRRNIKEHQKK